MSLQYRQQIRRSNLARASLWVLMLWLVVSAAESAAQLTTETGRCTEPDGTTYRVSYRLDPLGVFGPTVTVTGIDVSKSPAGPFSRYRDDASTRSRLESWTPRTFDDLFLRVPSGFAAPFVTLALDQQSYATWWSDADGPAAILASPRVTYLNPRVQLRDRPPGVDPRDPTDRLGRGRDRCNVYLGSYAGPATGERVALLGDSIGIQMAPRLFQLFAGHRFFYDAQSGQSLQSMLGEARGIAAGVRTPGASGTLAPDVLVLELGTNDARGFSLRPGETIEQLELRLALVLLRLVFDTANVRCKVLMTVRTSGADPAPWNDSRLLAAEQALNELVRSVVASNPSTFRLVDFEAMAETHRPGAPDTWYDTPIFGVPGAVDRVHPNAAGLTALSTEIATQVAACLED